MALLDLSSFHIFKFILLSIENILVHGLVVLPEVHTICKFEGSLTSFGGGINDTRRHTEMGVVIEEEDTLKFFVGL